MIEKNGDVFTSDAPALGHGVNTRGAMGAGIAPHFAKRWPEMESQYIVLCRDQHLNPGETFVYKTEDGRWVYNMASQDLPGPNAAIDWLSGAAEAAAFHASENGVDRIAIPRIGCGIGGLDWDDVSAVLEQIELSYNMQFEVWTL